MGVPNYAQLKPLSELGLSYPDPMGRGRGWWLVWGVQWLFGDFLSICGLSEDPCMQA